MRSGPGCALRAGWGLALAGLLMFAGQAVRAGSEPPPILVIGSTAKSSAQIMEQALTRGHRVTGLARRPEAVTLRHERLTVVRGDVYDQASLEAAMTGREVVISMVGPRVDPMREVEAMDLFTVGTSHIIAAMRNRGNRRLLVASSLGVEHEFPARKPAGDDLGSLWLWNARRLYQDMAAMEDIVRGSGLEFVILRPPFLVEESARGDLRVSVDTPSPKQRMLTYADFAAFVLDQVTGDAYVGRTVGLYTDRQLEWGGNADFDALAEDAARVRGEAEAQR